MRKEIRKGLRSIIATREYTRRRKRRSTRVVIEIGKPQHLPREGKLSDWWACPYRIDGLGEPIEGYAGGLDAFQSLQLALRLAAEAFLASLPFKRGELFWGKVRLRDATDVAMPLSIERLQLAVEITLMWLQKSRGRMSREALEGFRAMLAEANESLRRLAEKHK